MVADSARRTPEGYLTDRDERLDLLETRLLRRYGVPGQPGIPYRQAAGKVASNPTGAVVVAFPVGRFSVPPVVGATLTSYAANVQILITAISATQMTVVTYNVSTGTNIAGVTFDWTAVQMTDSAGPG